MLDRIRGMISRPGIDRRPGKGGGRRSLSPAQVKEIRRRWGNGESQRQLAAEFGISQPAIWQIVTRVSYKDIA